jgi:hypothetical protein
MVEGPLFGPRPKQLLSKNLTQTHQLPAVSFAAIDADYVAGHPVRTWQSKRNECTRDVGWLSESS